MIKKLFSLFLIFCLFSSLSIAEAAGKKKKVVSAAAHKPLETSIVVDAVTGEILHAEKARQQIYPASLTKVMTLYLTFAAIEDGRLKVSDYVTVSKEAASMLPSKTHLKAGDKVKIYDAILAAIIKSANDMAVVLAESVAGSHADFVDQMNIYAKKLGMHSTHFTNASGWHDPKLKSTAVDMAKLAIAIRRDFPKYYYLFSKTEFKLGGVSYKGHNKITALYPGAEGLKTGFHSPGGFSIVSSAVRKGKRLIAVVTGGTTASSRDRKIIHLLDKHFGEKSSIAKIEIAKASERVTKKELAEKVKKVSKKKQKNKKKIIKLTKSY